VVVIDPQYSFSQSLIGVNRDFLPTLDISAHCYGSIDNYEVILMPVYSGHHVGGNSVLYGHSFGQFHGHWMLVIHERNVRTIFYESLGNTNYLDKVRPQISRTLSELDPTLRFTNIPFICSRAGKHHNQQTDGVSCGVFLVLYAEYFLFNDRHTFLRNFEITTERKRLTTHLSDLFFSDDANYIRRPIDAPLTAGKVILFY
jgi:hypothetical protein